MAFHAPLTRTAGIPGFDALVLKANRDISEKYDICDTHRT